MKNEALAQAIELVRQIEQALQELKQRLNEFAPGAGNGTSPKFARAIPRRTPRRSKLGLAVKRWLPEGHRSVHIILSLRCGERKGRIRRVKHWEIIADNLSKAGWGCGCVSSTDHEGRVCRIGIGDSLSQMR